MHLPRSPLLLLLLLLLSLSPLSAVNASPLPEPYPAPAAAPAALNARSTKFTYHLTPYSSTSCGRTTEDSGPVVSLTVTPKGSKHEFRKTLTHTPTRSVRVSALTAACSVTLLTGDGEVVRVKAAKACIKLPAESARDGEEGFVSVVAVCEGGD